MTRPRKPRSLMQRDLRFSDAPVQVSPWVWLCADAESSCPGCGRKLLSGPHDGHCCLLDKGGRNAFMVCCWTEYERTRFTDRPKPLFVQVVFDVLQRFDAAQDGDAT